MSNSDSIDKQSENSTQWPDSVQNREVAQANWEKSRPQQLENYEKVITATEVPMPSRYTIQIKGHQYCLTRAECIKLYRALLEVLPQQQETVCDTIIIAVARAFRVSVRELKSPNREDHITLARHAAIWIAEHLGLTRAQMAESFHRERTTITYALREFRDRMEVDPKLKRRMEELRPQVVELINGGSLI